MKFSFAVIAIIGNISAKQLIPHDAPIGYILMGEEPAAAEAPVAADAPEAKADAAEKAAVATAPDGAKSPIPVSDEEAKAAEAATNPEAKKPSTKEAADQPAMSDGSTFDNSVKNGGYTGMVYGRSRLGPESLELEGAWSNLNYGPYKKTTGAPNRFERALGRPDDATMRMPVYGDAGGQNKFTN
tara:strand:+ start:50 stop:604 length:555 start_codon:yes stop_codon:yes gene_type:complete